MLRQLSDVPIKDLGLLDPIAALKVNSLDYVEMKSDKERIEGTLLCYTCIKCPQFLEHVRVLYSNGCVE